MCSFTGAFSGVHKGATGAPGSSDEKRGTSPSGADRDSDSEALPRGSGRRQCGGVAPELSKDVDALKRILVILCGASGGRQR